MEENYKKTGVRVVTICFGATDTSLLHQNKLGTIDDDQLDHFIGTIVKNHPKQK